MELLERQNRADAAAPDSTRAEHKAFDLREQDDDERNAIACGRALLESPEVNRSIESAMKS